MRPLAIRSRAVLPAEFNTMVEEYGSKGELLSRITIGLVADLLSEVCTSPCADDSSHASSHYSSHAENETNGNTPDEPVLIVCDKHGGRNRYGELLQRQFPDTLIEVHGESRARSTYRWGPRDARIEIQFRVGGESFMPTGLASMASKYLREISMRAFNQYWRRRVTGLKPTAGYPLDARRFHAEIALHQIKLDIPDQTLWRVR